MDGAPQDVEGECNAWLVIGDDYGDNSATMRCQLKPGHEGPHREEFQRVQRQKSAPVVITWYCDQHPCDACEGTGYLGFTEERFAKTSIKELQKVLNCPACDGSRERG